MPQLDAEQRARTRELKSRLEETVCELERLVGRPVVLRLELPAVEFAKPEDSDTYSVLVPLGSPLMDLAAVTDRASRMTGIRLAHLVGYVLTGMPPPRVRWRLTHRVSHPGPLSSVEIAFRAQDICWRDMERVYEQIPEARGRKRATLIDSEDAAVWDAVQELGGIPKAGLEKFWERVRVTAARRGGKEYQGWQGPMMR